MKSLELYVVFEQCKSTLVNVLSKHLFYQGFKIGKTTQALEERFSQNYADEYEGIELLYDGRSDGQLIDELEKEMIEDCLDSYGEECDNEQVGGGPNCEDNTDAEHSAKLYVVWR